MRHWANAYDLEWYIGSNQFAQLKGTQGRIKPDDVIWSVSIPTEPGTEKIAEGFCLFGKLQIGELTRDRNLIAELMQTQDIWKANEYAVATLGTESPYRLIDISVLAPPLRFEGKHPTLAIQDGLIRAQQLQTIRILTPESVALLERVWAN